MILTALGEWKTRLSIIQIFTLNKKNNVKIKLFNSVSNSIYYTINFII